MGPARYDRASPVVAPQGFSAHKTPLYDIMKFVKIPPHNLWKTLAHRLPADSRQSSQAAKFFREYESEKYLRYSGAMLVSLPLPLIADFFSRMSLTHSTESPIFRRRDTRWMSEYDYTLVNIRAAGTQNCPASILGAAMYLTTLRTKAIILAPFTTGKGSCLSWLQSHVIIRDELVSSRALEVGFDSALQIGALVEAAHLLDLAVGYQLDSSVHIQASVVHNKPQLFLWTENGEINAEKNHQRNLHQQVESIVSALKRTKRESRPDDYANALGRVGLAPLGNFDDDQLCTLALDYSDAAVSYWGRIFSLWRECCNFDFLSLSGTRLLGNREGSGLNLDHLKKIAHMARKGGVRNNIGVMAEGSPMQVETLGIHGIDLVQDDISETRANQDWFKAALALDEKLRHVNLGRKLKFSVPLSVNPGEKESKPRRERAHIKRFVARFLGAGPARRPLLETMGSLEGAWGYTGTLDNRVTLGWMSNLAEAEKSNNIEDVANYYRDVLKNGERLDGQLKERQAWWIIRFRLTLLIAVVSVENEDLLPPEPLRIDYLSYLKKSQLKSMLEYDFTGTRGKLQLSTDTLIHSTGIPYRGFRLYVIN